MFLFVFCQGEQKNEVTKTWNSEMTQAVFFIISGCCVGAMVQMWSVLQPPLCDLEFQSILLPLGVKLYPLLLYSFLHFFFAFPLNLGSPEHHHF